MDVLASPKTNLLRMGEEAQVFSRSQVWPSLRLTRFFRLSNA
jgi:hypothetical protein